MQRNDRRTASGNGIQHFIVPLGILTERNGYIIHWFVQNDIQESGQLQVFALLSIVVVFQKSVTYLFAFQFTQFLVKLMAYLEHQKQFNSSKKKKKTKKKRNEYKNSFTRYTPVDYKIQYSFANFYVQKD